MTPFYSSSAASSSLQEREAIEALYTTQTIESLERLGFEVVSPEALTQGLVEAGAWEAYEAGLTFRHSLNRYFLDLPRTEAPEIDALLRLGELGVLPEGAMLFGEVVYQSETTCRVYADETVSFAVVEGTSRGDGDGVACVVSHVQSTLIEAKTARMMWINRALVELHVETLDEDARVRGVARAVQRVYEGEGGLAEFIAR